MPLYALHLFFTSYRTQIITLLIRSSKSQSIWHAVLKVFVQQSNAVALVTPKVFNTGQHIIQQLRSTSHHSITILTLRSSEPNQLPIHSSLRLCMCKFLGQWTQPLSSSVLLQTDDDDDPQRARPFHKERNYAIQTQELTQKIVCLTQVKENSAIGNRGMFFNVHSSVYG